MTATSNPAGWKALPTQPIGIDEPIRWGCSGKGWHCCTDKVIPVRPYELVRLRHAVRKPAQALLAEQLVTFVWDGAGTLIGTLAQVPYERTRKACIFYEEVTNVWARRVRDEDPERFAALPPQIHRAAESTQGGEWRVAGLCRAHGHRPEACRGFPFQRDPERERRRHDSPAIQVFRCGTCALSTETTPRAVMADNALDPFWHADDAFLDVARYLHRLGAAQVRHPDYRSLPITMEAKAELWASMYAADTHPAIAERFPDQWLLAADPDGDEAIYRLLLEQAMDRAEAIVAEHGLDRAALGRAGDPLRPRPDLDAVFDRSRDLFLPVIRTAAGAA